MAILYTPPSATRLVLWFSEQERLGLPTRDLHSAISCRYQDPDEAGCDAACDLRTTTVELY